MPSAVEDWRSVAMERSTDANRLKEMRREVAAIYMMGYAIECSLKAYLCKIGKTPVVRGREGHDLRGLWRAAGFRPDDFSAGKKWFVQSWSTSLRYELELPERVNFEELYAEGYKLMGYIQNKIRWAKERGVRAKRRD